MTAPTLDPNSRPGIQSTQLHAMPWQRLGLFAIEALLVLIALALAALLMCALEQRLGLKPADFGIIVSM